MARHSFLAVLGTAIAVAIALSGCGGSAHPPAHPQTALPPVTVSATTAVRRSLPLLTEVVGTVEARLEARVAAKISGTVVELPVEPGSLVAAGDLLVALEAREVEARRDRARAGAERAGRELERMRNLHAKGTISQSAFDAVVAEAEMAEAAAREAATMLAYTRITAPFAGVVSDKAIELGDLALPGHPLLTLADPDRLRLAAAVPEVAIDGLALGQHLRILGRHRTITGSVDEISPTAEPRSRTVLVRVALPHDHGLRLGQFARLAVPRGTSEAIMVPEAALLRRGQLVFVAVIRDGHADLRLVRTGRLHNGWREVVSGLGGGEPLVAPVPETLRDGQALEVLP